MQGARPRADSQICGDSNATDIPENNAISTSASSAMSRGASNQDANLTNLESVNALDGDHRDDFALSAFEVIDNHVHQNGASTLMTEFRNDILEQDASRLQTIISSAHSTSPERSIEAQLIMSARPELSRALDPPIDDLHLGTFFEDRTSSTLNSNVPSLAMFDHIKAIESSLNVCLGNHMRSLDLSR